MNTLLAISLCLCAIPLAASVPHTQARELLGGAKNAATYPTKFEVTSLPGWVQQDGKTPAKLPSKMYTGFIDAGTPPSGRGTMFFHYWMVQSEGNPSTDPVLFWYNGGPGASSLFGLLQEWGPLRLLETSYDSRYNETNVPTPQFNPYRWTQTHTVVAIDSPPPMGMSFCSEEGPSGSPLSCGAWTDKSVFAANHAAHRSFFEKIFPELKPNPFFFTGESYAGIYVPGFADEMLKDPIPGLNFQGWAVGDGWTGCKPMPGKPVNWCVNLDNVGMGNYPNVEAGPFYDVEFFHGHSQFSNKLYRSIMRRDGEAACSDKELTGETMPMGKPCKALIDQMWAEVGYVFPYNLYNVCPTTSMHSKKPAGAVMDKHGMNRAARAKAERVMSMAHAMKLTPKGAIHSSGLSSPCLGNAMNDWFLLPETLEAIGAPSDSNFINLDNGHGFNYTGDQPFVGAIYERAIRAGKRVMIYEGDVDACGLQTSNVEDVFVPLFDDTIGLEQTQEWRPWTAKGDGKMGGYVMEWRGGVRFVSVRGAGHLVPLNRPEASYTMMSAFTSNTTLPRYHP